MPAPTSLNAAYQLENFAVEYNGKQLVAVERASVPRAAFTVVCGKNGAGKSTLLRGLVGVVPKQNRRGVAWTHDQAQRRFDVGTVDAETRAELIAWVPPPAASAFGFSVLDVVVLGRFAKHRGTPRRLDVSAAHSALSAVGLADFAPRSISTLSAGEQARVAVARGLAAETDILVLDEPAANLDVAAAIGLMTMIKSLTRAGKTVVASMHDLGLAQRHADHLLVLSRGRLVGEGAPPDALSDDVLASAFGLRARWVDDAPHGRWPLFSSVDQGISP